MDMLKCIETFQPVSVFQDKPLPDDVLNKILEITRWTPSGANSQPVDYLVIKNKDSREKIRNMAKEVLAMANVDSMETLYKFMKETGTMEKSGAKEVPWDEYMNAPVMVVVLTNVDLRGTEYEDFHHFTMESQAAEAHVHSMMLAAHAEGLGSMWNKYFDPERIKLMFDIPRTMYVAGIVLLGYPKYTPKAPELALSTDPKLYPKRPLEDMIHENKFDLEKWTQFQLYDPWRLPRKEFLRTEKYIRPTKLTGKAGK
ncbi:MAG: hypothetical protein CVU86_03250 [Firmicutes bacterium HGW-Firmicutes-11]|jgi:nitroreductase|nr:MAG: hypothetical protein CVU86_03250 [Firmicutes bacterium HGW-Firmicutes-11]